ncbi:hypothetical protein MZO42_18970 [Sphingomonas psychrotolerans]|uniref:Uncharacterized protein n=1 Tax=Sphingomonas psychrotolerans TaxID=1327635 RepID=A0ABU3N8G4_9SPHN|nr:hypothetical protein [Sphingomonas psychrotolerans]MDT8760789.1 hypothetical protein [Sphingomonas psychrotolerans]
MEELDESGRTKPYDHPVIATLAGAAVLVLGALLLPRLASPQPLAVLLCAGAGFALLLWAIGFAVTTRYSILAWKLGSLALLVIAGLGAAVIAHGQYETIARADASSFAEVEFGPGGAAQVPAGAASRGPLSRLFVESVTADAQALRDFGAAFGKLGAANLTSPYLLEQDPRPLTQCAAIAGLQSRAKAQATARSDRAKAMAHALDAANLPAKAKEGIAIMAGARPADTASDPLLANQLAMTDATAELCQLLAKRSWFNNGSYFGFRNGDDDAQFRALAKRRITLAGEAERIQRDRQQQIAAGREVVRDVLSKSIFVGS